jgi:hypothetical protein
MSTDTISPLRQRMIEDMNARKLCAGTQKGPPQRADSLRIPASENLHRRRHRAFGPLKSKEVANYGDLNRWTVCFERLQATHRLASTPTHHGHGTPRWPLQPFPLDRRC